ncbi:vacuolar protein sorting-associated protein 13 [Drosophila novamexicana]|uniref:vacuolar protein sorting-associated protein 13 n=1 Tax=Drosophila novamexicana TaxID=47314 RepID=UPI0011E5F34A|nr:vacuolar protein sorting-associated protein 13 [Drosophila novamexicana]XP_030555740.1 vacuolar protein sorting-associated protein 13 [Drosophila novamexicana]
MVFEAVVADVLNKVLGDYIENLDHKQLKIGIWGGDVVLQNLKIRSNALDSMDLPVQLIYGYLGKLVLKIPWKNLYSQPVIVDIDDLYVLVTPNNNVRYNAEREAKYALAAKMAALDAMEAERKRELLKDQPRGDAGFTEKLTAQIVNNLQIKICNVHLRYEDTTTTGSPFSFGITLHELELYTTDSKWDKCYMTERLPQVFKIANLSCLAVYMNCKAMLYAEQDKNTLADTFKDRIARKDYKPASYFYVLGPISCNAKLKLNMNPELDVPAFEKPKIDLSLEMETLNVGLTNTQFHNILQLADSMNRMQLGLPYRRYRPYNIPYKGHYREWWQFAITAVLEHDVRRVNRTWNWQYIKEHRELCNTYAEKYKERELNKKPPKILLEACSLLEQKLDVFNLLLIRQRVNIDIAKLQENEPRTSTGWFSSWWSGDTAKKDESDDTGVNIVRKFEAAMTPEEKAKMYKAIGYEENAKPGDVPESYVAMKMNFKLIALEIGLYQELREVDLKQGSSFDYFNLPSIILLKFSMATASITQRPAAEAISLTAGMKELKMTGLTRENRTPMLVQSITTDEFNLLDIFFETNPLDKECNQRVKVVARPLQIIYDAETILNLISIFQPPTNVNLSRFEETAASRLVGIKERSATGMQYVIDQKSVLDADILLMPNIIVVPHGGLYVAEEKSLVVLSLGQVHVTTKPHHRTDQIKVMHTQGQERDEILKSVMENAYDKFVVEVNDVQILVVRPEEQWQRVLNMAVSTELHVLQPTSLQITAALCVFDNDPRMPKVKIDIELPAVQLNFTEDRMLEAIDVATSIPMPQNKTIKAAPILSRSHSSISNFLNREIKKRPAAPPPSNTLIQEEIIQYTNVELNFSLKEISLTLFQSNAMCETSSGATSTAFATPEQENISSRDTFDTSLDEITTDMLVRRFSRPSEHILSIKVLQVEAYMAQRTYETVASAKLGSINVKHFDCVDNTDQVLDIIDTPGYAKDLKYLLTVSYTQADKCSPEFSTKYNSTEQLVVANFEILNVVLHQECLQRLLKLSSNFQRRLDVIYRNLKPRDRYASAGDGDGLKHKLQVIIEDTETIITTQVNLRRLKAPKQNAVVDSVKMRMVSNIEEISLKLTTRRRPLAAMHVKNFVSNVTLKESYTEVNIGLKDIIVLDLNPLTKHTRILSIVGQDAFNCQVVLYNKEFTHDYNSDDIKITVDIGCMKIMFLNWFVAGVLSFLGNFQAAQQALTQASAAAAQSARQNAIDAYEKATRIKLNVRIKAPIICVPVDSQSKNALAIDFGLLEITNNTSEVRVPDRDELAVIDEIKVQLKDVKITKVIILDENDDTSVDDVDALLGMKTSLNMMDPMSFTLSVTRNLSFSWYRDIPEINLSGHLKFVELTLFMDDYALVMSILSRNLGEGVREFPPREPAFIEKPSMASMYSESRPTQSARPSPILPEKIFETLKFNFQFDGVVINLMEDQSSGLACFGIYFLSVKGTQLNNGTLSLSIVLCNIQLDDTRSSNRSKIRQYLSCKDWDEVKSRKAIIVETCQNEPNYMVDVTAIIKENDIFAEVRVRSFDLIVCIDFLLKLTMFLALPTEIDEKLPKSKVPPIVDTAARGTARMTVTTLSSSAVSVKKMNLILHIDQPDIILVESLDDLNTNAIVFNAKAHLNYRSIGDKQLINGQIDGLKIYMCSFLPERRELTRHYILHPAVISLQGSTPEEEGMHISLKLSDIIINISPATIELLNKAMVSISSGAAKKAAIEKDAVDYSKMWYPKSFHSKTYWFTKVEQATEAIELDPPGDFRGRQKTEKCVIEVPSITIVIESGMGYYTKPLISLDTRMTAVFDNWSRNLTAHGSLTLNMNYYNQFLAEWEPIIELNEVVGRNGVSEYIPWELQFDMDIETSQNEFDEHCEEQTMNIRIHSNESLEITLSKTCVSLISELTEAFSQAIDSKGLIKPDVVAPYIVQNDTGFDITLDLTEGIFTLHETHRGGNAGSNSIILNSQSNDQMVNPGDIQECTISSGGRAYLQTKDLSTVSEEQAEDYNLYVAIPDLKSIVVLPVSKADTRYFPLKRNISQEQWAIVSQVKLEYGTTIINIHGVISIVNHFTTPISVHRRRKTDNSIILVGYANPNEVFNLPLHAIYADYKDLYFAIKGYRTSVQGFVWNAYPSDENYSHQVQCDPIDAFEPLNINVRRKKHEIYFENTSKYRLLSAYYTIHLRPPLYLLNSLPIDIKVSVAGCLGRQSTPVQPVRGSGQLPGAERFQKEDFLDYGEKEVNPGHVLHLPTVRMFEKGKESKSVLVVRLLQYLEKDWSYATEICNGDSGISIWTFASYDSEFKMEMDLYVRANNRHGSIVLTLYSPYWMINKTGMMLTYKTDFSSVEVLYHPPEYSGPILFTFRDKLFFDKKKASIRVDSGEWSEKIPLDVAGSIGGVTCNANDQSYQIGVHNHLTHNSLTKQITFIPFYIVHNKCKYTIELQELKRPGDPWLILRPQEYKPLWPKNDSTHKLIVRVGNQTTPAFDYTEVTCTLLKLHDSRYGGVNVDVQTTEGGIYLTFTEYQPSEAPGLIINHTTKDIVYYEKNTKIENILRAKHSVLYAWGDPTGPKLLIFGKDKQETDLKRDQIDNVVLQDGSKAYWVSFLYGMQRVLLFTEVEAIAKRTESTAALQNITRSIDLHIHGIGFSLVNNEIGVAILYLGVTSSGIIWESRKPNKKRYKELTIHESELIEAEYQRYLVHKAVKDVQTYVLDNKFPINFGTMTLVKHVERRLRRNFYPAIWVSMKSSPFQNQLHVKINRIQVDNQFLDPIFPVVLAPIAPPKSVATTTTMKPFIECSMVQRIIPNSEVKQYKYATILIQEFHFKVDIVFLTAIAEMFASEVTDEHAAKLFRSDVDSIELPLSTFFEQHSQQEQKNFYDNLHLSPLKIHVSFSMAGSDTKALPGFLGRLVQGVGVTLTDVNDVVFRLAFFEREYQFFTQHQLVSEVTSHYTGQALKQLYVLALGLDVLGNPYGLVVGLKKGVEDLFYEPFQGAIQGPGEFAEGLVLGVKSLFGHTVGGAAGAMSKITGAMGKGLAALTFDDDYQRKRRQGMHNKPKNFHEGLARSGKGLVMGFVDGVTGVVTKPVHGAREEGAQGFFKGLGKGAIGLVARPTAGVVDFASGSFEAVKRATVGSEDAKRLRPARFLHYDNVLRPYCYSEALGNKMLKELDKGKYASTDTFIHCEEIVQKLEYLIITNHRMLYTQRNDMFGVWVSLWSYQWDEVESIEATQRGIQFRVKRNEGKRVLGLFASKESPQKLVLVPDERKRLALLDVMESHQENNTNMRVPTSRYTSRATT